MNLIGVIITTLLVYGGVKFVRYMVDKSYQDGYNHYQDELWEQADEIVRKIKGE